MFTHSKQDGAAGNAGVRGRRESLVSRPAGRQTAPRSHRASNRRAAILAVRIAAGGHWNTGEVGETPVHPSLAIAVDRAFTRNAYSSTTTVGENSDGSGRFKTALLPSSF